MFIIPIKPLSQNACFKRGRNNKRLFLSKDYENYKKELIKWLKDYDMPNIQNYEIEFVFGLSNSNADYDNPVKPLQDIISKYYEFNDKQIQKGTVTKVKVPRGKEFLAFRVIEYNRKLPHEIESYLCENNISLPIKNLQFNI